MQGELLRLVKRSPFDVRLPKPRREGSGVSLYPFDPAVAWVAAVHHRTCSRVEWTIASSPAVRLDPLVEDLAVMLGHDERWLSADGEIAFSVRVGDAPDFEAAAGQLRGAVRAAVEEAARARGRRTRVETEAPTVAFQVARIGADEARRTALSIDLGGAGRHRRGLRAVEVTAPLRETLAAQLVLATRWDARREPLVDPMAGGGTIVLEAAALSRAEPVRRPSELPALALPAFAGLPDQAAPLFPDTMPRLLAADRDPEALRALRENVAAAGWSEGVAVLERSVGELHPELVAESLGVPGDEPGVFAVNPPYGRRLETGPSGDETAAWRELGQALRRFDGWRAGVLVAAEEFPDVIGLRPASTRPASPGGLRGAIHLFDLGRRAPR